jgi:hypothetical protein
MIADIPGPAKRWLLTIMRLLEKNGGWTLMPAEAGVVTAGPEKRYGRIFPAWKRGP